MNERVLQEWRRRWRGTRAGVLALVSDPIPRTISLFALLLVWVAPILRHLAQPSVGATADGTAAPNLGLGLTSVAVAFITAYAVSEEFAARTVDVAIIRAGGRARHFHDKVVAAMLVGAVFAAISVVGGLAAHGMFGASYAEPDTWGPTLVGAVATNVVVGALGTGVGFLVRGGAAALMTALALLCVPPFLAGVATAGAGTSKGYGAGVLSLMPLVTMDDGGRCCAAGSYLLIALALAALVGGAARLARPSMSR